MSSTPPNERVSSEFSPKLTPAASRSTRTSPYQQRSRNLRRFLEDSGLLVERVLSVLHFMRANDIDLATLLWALWAVSWNVDELNQDTLVSFERTSLMLSDDLPQILDNWFRPSRSHSAGTCTQAGRRTMRDWSVDTVCRIVDEEMKGTNKCIER